jgi:hypothetical protein
VAEFVLQPARLRDDRLVVDPISDEITMQWPEARARLTPSNTRQALNMIRLVRPGWFIGTRKQGDGVVTFVMDAAGKSSSISGVIQKNPRFGEQLIEVFYVNSVTWDASMAEAV